MTQWIDSRSDCLLLFALPLFRSALLSRSGCRYSTRHGFGWRDDDGKRR